ncbi:hypothetical protein K458DRAFT_395008 [Lentithecium fluviatile CBS 122367]|uniref:Uncharacterized protein n=1 Tax=Lentithecium fluviatile CBS 122367 TaxID=1168545 RepID=A0A6G1IJP8_9PLEO|nr:hypothetical protein K458DRAFT_395008 [Lentithecium fluviatile CBS 122367]
MAPRNLLKQVFRNILHQKSMETMRPPNDNGKAPQQQTTIEFERPHTAPLEPTHDWVDDQSVLDTIDEASDSSGTTAEHRAERNTDQQGPSPEALEYFHRLLQFTETMTVSHLDTIETTLTLLEALEKFSPEVEPLRKEILEKKSWCESQLKEVHRAEGREDE